MPTIFIDNIAIQLPVRFNEGDVCDAVGASVLNTIHLNRLRSRLRWLVQKGQIDLPGLQIKADELAQLDLQPYDVSDDDDDEVNDPILAEALSLARAIITTEMAKQGLPPPKGIDLHAKELVDGMPALLEQARKRVEARQNVANAALEALA